MFETSISGRSLFCIGILDHNQHVVFVCRWRYVVNLTCCRAATRGHEPGATMISCFLDRILKNVKSFCNRVKSREQRKRKKHAAAYVGIQSAHRAASHRTKLRREEGAAAHQLLHMLMHVNTKWLTLLISAEYCDVCSADIVDFRATPSLLMMRMPSTPR